MSNQTNTFLKTIENSVAGRKEIANIRKSLKGTNFYIKIRGRHSNRKELFRLMMKMNNGFYPNHTRDVPTALAERYAIYMYTKTNR